MALFSRRPKASESDRTPEPEPTPAAVEVAAEAVAAPAVESAIAAEVASPADSGDAAAASAESDAPAVADAEPVPTVGISISTFGQPAAPQAARPAAEPPAATEVVAGMPDNVLVRAALQALPSQPQNTDIMNVMRQTLQGRLYLRVRGDAAALVAQGKPLTLAVTQVGDNRFLLAFTGGAAVQDSIRIDHDKGATAVAQPAEIVLQNLLAGPYTGLILDHATPDARIVLPAELVEKSMEEAGDAEFTLKNLLSGPRTDATVHAVAEALTRVKLWVAGGPADDNGGIGLAEARGESGTRRLEVYSHPLEVIAMGRGDRPLPLTGIQLGKALASDAGLSGIVVDPSGPWIELDRGQLAPVLALAG